MFTQSVAGKQEDLVSQTCPQGLCALKSVIPSDITPSLQNHHENAEGKLVKMLLTTPVSRTNTD